MATELATGYISLTVKYKDAMKAINQDFTKVAKTAQTAGTKAGQQFSQGMSRSTTNATKSLDNTFKNVSNQAAAAGKTSGKKFSAGFESSVKGSGKSAGGEFVAGFGGAVSKLGTKGGPIALALLAVGGTAFAAGGLVAKQFLAGVEKGQQKANFAAAVGLSPGDAKIAAGAAGRAYANNFGASVQENLDAAKIVLQSGLVSGAGDPGLQRMIEQSQTVATVMGTDVLSVVRATSQMLKTGLAPDAEAAFDVLVKGQQAGVNSSEDLLDTFNEYGTQFRKLGLSAEDALGLMSQMLKGGARDSDVAADAIKEFSIRAVDGSESTVTGFTDIGLNAEEMAQKLAAGGPTAAAAFDQVLDAVRSIQDPVKRAQVSVALFGTQAEDLGDAMAHMDLSNARNQLGGVAGAAQQATDTMSQTTASSLESMKRNFEVALGDIQEDLATAFGPALVDGLTKFSNWIKDNKQEIIEGFGAVVDAVLLGVQLMIGSIGGVVIEFGKFAKAAGFLTSGVLDAAAALSLLQGNAGEAKRLHDAANAARGWGDSIEEAGRGMTTFAEGMTDVRDKIKGSINDYAQAVDVTDALRDAVVTLPDGKTITIEHNTPEVEKKLKDLGITVKQLPNGKFVLETNVPEAQAKIDAFVRSNTGANAPTIGMAIQPTDTAGHPVDKLEDLFGGSFTLPTVNLPVDTTIGPAGGGRARGGGIGGTGNRDTVPAMLTPGEHVLTTKDVAALGGQGGVYAFRNALHRQGGGGIPWLWPLMDPRGTEGTTGSGAPTGHGPFNPRWDNTGHWSEHALVPSGPLSPGSRYWERGPTVAPGPGGRGIWPEWKREWGVKPWLPFWKPPDQGIIGFKGGGEVEDMMALAKRIGIEKFGLNPTTYTDSSSSYHNTGEAFDFVGSGVGDPNMLAFAQYMSSHYRSKILELIYDAPKWNDNIKDGRDVGAFGEFYTMAQAGDHTDHVHLAVKKGTTADGAAPSKKRRGGPSPDDLSDDSSDEEIAHAILAEAERRGYTREEAIAILATAIGESGLDPNVTNSIGRHGVFQQDEGYPGRFSAGGQVSGFFDRLSSTTGGKGGRKGSGDIYSNITGKVQKGGYGADWIQQYEDQASDFASSMSDVTDANDDAVSDASDLAQEQESSNPYTRIIEAVKEILPDFGAMADIAVGGVKETFLPPGFSDPMEWGVFKMASGVMGFLSTLTDDPVAKGMLQMGSAIASGSGSGVVSAIEGLIPAPFGNLQPKPGQSGPGLVPGGVGGAMGGAMGSALAGGAGQQPVGAGLGQGSVIDNSIHIAEGGQVGAKPSDVQDRAHRQQVANQNIQIGTRRMVG